MGRGDKGGHGLPRSPSVFRAAFLPRTATDAALGAGPVLEAEPGSAPAPGQLQTLGFPGAADGPGQGRGWGSPAPAPVTDLISFTGNVFPMVFFFREFEESR